MLPLMEMLMQGGGGSTLDQIARQYGLSTAQTERAIEALMPAFSQGLKRNASDPYGFAGFLEALSSGQHAGYHDNPAAALSTAGIEEGNAILGHLFGSKDVSRAVAAQAAQMTGLSQSILKSMLPALAPMILGGLFKQLSGGQSSGRQSSGSTVSRQGPSGGGNAFGPLGQIFEQMTNSMGAGNVWGKMIEDMMGGAGSSGRSAPPASGRGGGGDNPLGNIFEDMLKGGLGGGLEGGPGGTQGAPPEPQDSGEKVPDEAPPAGKGGLEDLWGDMFETGRKMQKDYNRQVESIFDDFLDGMKKR